MSRLSLPRTSGRTHLALGLSLLLWCGLTAVPIEAQTGAEEPDLIAAYLNQFAKHVEWPGVPGATKNLILCTLGREEVHKALVEAVQGKEIRGRALQPAYYKTLDGVEFCHLLFISESEEVAWEEVRSHLAGQSVLTVSDMDGFVELGGIIGLFWEGKHIRFDINASNARLAEIEIRSRLLGAAERVIGDPGSRRRSKGGEPVPGLRPEVSPGGGV
jgi:hypothetical protein